MLAELVHRTNLVELKNSVAGELNPDLFYPNLTYLQKAGSTRLSPIDPVFAILQRSYPIPALTSPENHICVYLKRTILFFSGP